MGPNTLGEDRLEEVIYRALTNEISDTAYLRRLSRKAGKAAAAYINDLAQAAMEEATRG